MTIATKARALRYHKEMGEGILFGIFEALWRNTGLLVTNHAEDNIVPNLESIDVQQPLAGGHQREIDGVSDGPELECGWKQRKQEVVKKLARLRGERGHGEEGIKAIRREFKLPSSWS